MNYSPADYAEAGYGNYQQPPGSRISYQQPANTGVRLLSSSGQTIYKTDPNNTNIQYAQQSTPAFGLGEYMGLRNAVSPYASQEPAIRPAGAYAGPRYSPGDLAYNAITNVPKTITASLGNDLADTIEARAQARVNAYSPLRGTVTKDVGPAPSQTAMMQRPDVGYGDPPPGAIQSSAMMQRPDAGYGERPPGAIRSAATLSPMAGQGSPYYSGQDQSVRLPDLASGILGTVNPRDGVTGGQRVANALNNSMTSIYNNGRPIPTANAPGNDMAGDPSMVDPNKPPGDYSYPRRAGPGASAIAKIGGSILGGLTGGIPGAFSGASTGNSLVNGYNRMINMPYSGQQDTGDQWLRNGGGRIADEMSGKQGTQAPKPVTPPVTPPPSPTSPPQAQRPWWMYPQYQSSWLGLPRGRYE